MSGKTGNKFYVVATNGAKTAAWFVTMPENTVVSERWIAEWRKSFSRLLECDPEAIIITFFAKVD